VRLLAWLKKSSLQSAWSGLCMGMKPQCVACVYGPGVWFGLTGSGTELLKKDFVLFVDVRFPENTKVEKCTCVLQYV
jgi:hypothetical protein